MRDDLLLIENVRDSFTGKFERIGGKGGKKFTILLLNITNSSGKKLCDHAWLNLGVRFKNLGWLEEGMIIRFDARIKKYRKGSVRRDIPVEYDYRFSHPSKVLLSPCKK